MTLPFADRQVTFGCDAASDRFCLERRFDASFVAKLALREKQVQQSYRPIIGIHKWFARRPGSLFRALLLAEFSPGSLEDDYWLPHELPHVVADPFMGGGTTIFEALRLGMSVVGSDINPMAYWLVRQAVEPIDLEGFRSAGTAVWRDLRTEIGDLYRTKCMSCGEAADAKYFLWVKTCSCPACGESIGLFPGYRVAEAVRHPREVYHCPRCSHLREFGPDDSRECPDCRLSLAEGNVRRGKASCPSCKHSFNFAGSLGSPPDHRLFAIEYNCASCYRDTRGRQFKAPDADDHNLVSTASAQLSLAEGLLIPDDEIPAGDETSRLLRWGYRTYRELFSERQQLGLGLLMRRVAAERDARLRHALATVFSDFLRYQNLLCRYDTYALKCQDIFSVHGFPVGLIACENNLPGIPKVGSGSFIHFVEKYSKAKAYAKRPHETFYDGRRKILVNIPGETVEAGLTDREPERDAEGARLAWLACGPSQDLALRPSSLDAVFTDPPYFDNVQYAELMDFCFVWLRRLLAAEVAAFEAPSTRTDRELTGNETLKRGIENFTEGISEVFVQMAVALKRGAPLVFTYHHNAPTAYAPLVIGLLDAGLTCTAVLPAPAEMAASLHIAGTGSSILDSVFVCRDRGSGAEYLAGTEGRPGSIDDLLEADRLAMERAGYRCTRGDLSCLRAGHVAATAIRRLGPTWDRNAPLVDRISKVKAEMLAIDVRAEEPGGRDR